MLVAGDRTPKTGTIPGNRGRLVTLELAELLNNQTVVSKQYHTEPFHSTVLLGQSGSDPCTYQVLDSSLV